MDDGRKTPVEVNPNFFAQECPVCNGFGSLAHGTKICYACGGRGYIVINNKTGELVEGGKNGRMDKTT